MVDKFPLKGGLEVKTMQINEIQDLLGVMFKKAMKKMKI